MGGAVPPLPNTPSWRDGQLGGAQGQFYLYLYIVSLNLNPVSDVESFLPSMNIIITAEIAQSV
jgi:hypothetical protein